MAEIKVGNKVKYLGINGEQHVKMHPCYPPVGTIGTVIDIPNYEDESVIYIQWPKGTTVDDGKWYCDAEYLEVVDEQQQ